ncbi:unnamed protein product [Hyaloperonospora brassicae]|uniref:RxLR effector protein n=1 Tax=Hyaloperonospora brassicae TaxID=162125 RepID=A0AAV0UNC2_HYABA|nr:unnamed protein product [Hyaloperonospora brassicae]
MHLHYVLAMAATALAANNGSISAAVPTNDVALWTLASQDQVHLIDRRIAGANATRTLRGALTINEDNTAVYFPSSNTHKKTFIEDRLKDSLANPETMTKFYKQWYEDGYTVEQVTRGLEEIQSRDLRETYANLAEGYAAYVSNGRQRRGSQRMSTNI